MYDAPLNELDDEIKAQIYNPTDPDCASPIDKAVAPFRMPRAARNKAINALATNVTKRIRKQTNNTTIVQTPQRREGSRSKSKGRKLLNSNQWNSTYTKSTMVDTAVKEPIKTESIKD